MKIKRKTNSNYIQAFNSYKSTVNPLAMVSPRDNSSLTPGNLAKLEDYEQFDESELHQDASDSLPPQQTMIDKGQLKS